MHIRLYLLYILLIFLFADCKKFPEDKFISLRTANGRFYHYKWEIKSVKLDGSDITNLYNDSLIIGNLADIDFQFAKKDDYDEYLVNIYYKNIPNDTFHLFSHYSFSAKYESFSITDFANSRSLNEKEDERILNNLFYKNFTIQKLYRKEFIIKDQRNIEITFIGQRKSKDDI